MKHKILESFRWLPPGDMRIKKGAGKKLIIRGRALFAGGVSRNLRKYVKEELVRAARTLIGKPVTINHDSHSIVGHVIDAEEEENAIEYVAEVNRHEYVQKLQDRKSMKPESYYKKWMVYPVSGVSVEADYRHNRCVECGEQFYDQESFEAHMWDRHKQKNFKFEPRGIIMKALSLVEPPEKPGVPGTTIELMETAEGMSRLMETLTTDLKKELEWRNKMKNVAAVSTEKSIAIGKSRKPKVKEQEEKDEHGCVIGKEEWKDGKCVPIPPKASEQEQTVQELPEPTVAPATLCPEGFEPDGAGGCKPIEWHEEPTAKTPAPLMVPEPTIEPPKVVDPTLVAPAPVAGPVLEQEEGLLPPAPFPTAPPEPPAAITQTCLPGSHYDKVAGTCVPDEIPEQPPGLEGRVDAGAPIVSEVKLPKFLSLGEPFADYKDFADCVAKNPQAKDPEAYCADIKRKVEGETVKETAGNIYEVLAGAEKRGFIRDTKLAEALNQEIRANAKITKVLQALPANLRKQILAEAQQRFKSLKAVNNRVTSESMLRAGYDRALGKTLLSEGKVRAKSDREILEYVVRAVLAEAKLRGAFDTRILKQTHVIPKIITESDTATRKYLKEVAGVIIEAVNQSIGNLKGYTDKKLSQLATAQAKSTKQTNQNYQVLSGKITEQKSDYEKILNAIDSKYQTEYKSLEQRVKEQEDELKKHDCPEGEHYDKEQDKCVPNKTEEPEAEETKKKLEETLTRVDNLEAKLKGDFKGKSKPVEKTTPEYSDPYKKKKK